MQYLSRENLRQIANTYLAGYEKKICRGVKIMRISPDLMATELLSLNITSFHLSKDGSVLGMTAFLPMGIEVWDDSWKQQIFFFGEGDILIEKNLQKDSGRYNFTLMHEIAHQILCRRFPEEPMKTVHRYEKKRQTERDWAEWQADTLAAYLLMPEAVVYHILHLLRADNGFNLLFRNYSCKEYQKFCDAAELLGVSKTALRIRLVELGLLRFYSLNDMLDIWKGDDDTKWSKQIAS